MILYYMYQCRLARQAEDYKQVCCRYQCYHTMPPGFSQSSHLHTLVQVTSSEAASA